MVDDFVCRVKGFGFGVEGLGFQVQGEVLRLANGDVACGES